MASGGSGKGVSGGEPVKAAPEKAEAAPEKAEAEPKKAKRRIKLNYKGMHPVPFPTKDQFEQAIHDLHGTDARAEDMPTGIPPSISATYQADDGVHAAIHAHFAESYDTS
jgi:hypothetical protein